MFISIYWFRFHTRKIMRAELQQKKQQQWQPLLRTNTKTAKCKQRIKKSKVVKVQFVAIRVSYIVHKSHSMTSSVPEQQTIIQIIHSNSYVSVLFYVFIYAYTVFVSIHPSLTRNRNCTSHTFGITVHSTPWTLPEMYRNVRTVVKGQP